MGRMQSKCFYNDDGYNMDSRVWNLWWLLYCRKFPSSLSSETATHNTDEERMNHGESFFIHYSINLRISPAVRSIGKESLINLFHLQNQIWDTSYSLLFLPRLLWPTLLLPRRCPFRSLISKDSLLPNFLPISSSLSKSFLISFLVHFTCSSFTCPCIDYVSSWWEGGKAR